MSQRITGLLRPTSLNLQNDLIPFVDVSDLTMSPSGSTRGITAGNLAESIGIVNVKNYGALGDGVTDDTAAIQAALNSGAKRVIGNPGDTYLVSFVGTKTINGTAHRYCLLIPDDVIFDLNGSTLKLADSQNAALVLNSTAGTTQNANCGVCNGILDGNQANQTSPATGEMACIFFHDVLRPQVYNLRAKNVRNYAGRFLKIDRGYFNNLHCEDSDGDGWSFGTAASSQHVLRSFIDNIYAEGCLGTYSGLVGNGVIFTVQSSQIGKAISRSCAAGLKIQDESSDSQFDELIFLGNTNGTTNAGVKVEGNGAGLSVKRVTIGRITSNTSFAYGAYFFDCLDCQVGSISTYGDATDGSTSSVYMDSTVNNLKIGTLHVENAGAGGVDCRGTDVAIGLATVKNSGQVTAGQNNFTAHASADGLYIGKLLSIDNQGTHTAAVGFGLQSGSKNITVDEYHSQGDYTTSGAHISDAGATAFRMNLYRIDDSLLYQAQATATAVGNVAGGEDDLQSLTIPARSLYANGKGYKVRANGFTANNANPKTFRLKFGTSTILTTALTINQASQFTVDAIIQKTGNNAQDYSSKLIQAGATSIIDIERGGPTETDTSAIIIKGTAEVTDGGGGINNDDLVMSALVIEPIL